MADKSLDELYIEIETKSEKAESKIDDLIQDLTKLKSALNGINDTGLSKLLNKLDSLKNNSLNRLANSVKSLSNSDLDKFSKNLGTVRSELDKFGNLGDGINNAGKGLNNLSKGAQRLSGVNIETTVGALKSIYNEISKFDTLSAKLANVASGLNGVGSAAKTAARMASSGKTTRKKKTASTEGEVPTGKDASGGFSSLTLKEIKKSIPLADKLSMAFARLKGNARDVGNSFKHIGNRTKDVISKLSKIAKVAKTAGSVLKKTFSAALNPIKTLSNLLKKLTSRMKSTGKSGRSMGSFLKEAFRGTLVYGGMFMALSAVMNSVTEGFQNMALGSERFNKTMSSLATSTLYMRNSLASALAPALNAIAPIVERLADGFAKVTEKMGMFLARLTGQGSYTKAVKTQVDYAASLDKTGESADDAKKKAEELKKTVSGFDELNLIKTQADDMSSSSSSSSSKYEEPTGNFIDVPAISSFGDRLRSAIEAQDFEGIGSLFAEKVNGIVNKINEVDWSSVTEKIGTTLTGITTAFNSFFSGLDWAGLSAGINSAISSVINGLNTFITGTDWAGLATGVGNGINLIFSALDTIFTGFDFASAGTAFANSVNGLFSSVSWEGIGKTISDGIHGIAEFLNNALTGIDWQGVGNALMDALNGIDWDTMGEDLGLLLGNLFVAAADLLTGIIEDLPELIDGLVNGLFAAVQAIPWGEVSRATFELLGAALGALAKTGIDSILRQFKVIEDFCQSVQDYFSQYFSWGDSPDEIINGLFQGINDALSDIGQWIEDNIFLPFMDGFNEAFGITGKNVSTVLEQSGMTLTEALKKGIGAIWDKVKEKFNKFKTDVTAWFNSKLTDFKNFGSEIITKIRDGIGDIWSKISQKFTDFKNKIKNFFSGLDIFKIKVSYEPTTILGNTVNLPKLSFKASGGYVNSGEAFIARENGMPEMVGRIGNRTAVANNDQIVQAVSNGVFNAIVSAMGMYQNNNTTATDGSLTVVVPLDGEVIYRNVINRHNSSVIMSGKSPLIVGG